MARSKGQSKKELLAEQIAAAVGAGREVAVETVDFSDPNRPKTCLEVDFPIIPINKIAGLEASSGALKKPIYGMSKWWARRQPSVFRSMLLAAGMKAPGDETKAAKAVWDVYYANHQKRGALRHLKVADPFMGGGTTIVEGSRLGMQMFGCDLNPVAWFVVKNEMAQVDIEEVKRLLDDIEAEVKPFTMPYYACDGPSDEKGKWFRRDEENGKWVELPPGFSIFSVPWQERKRYRYEGPELLYTFWAKHGPCRREGCGHRTPIMSTPVIALKTLSVDAWLNWECRSCGKAFDVERHAARLAPDAPLYVAPEEKPFAVMNAKGVFTCPHCGREYDDLKAALEGSSMNLGKAKNKKVELTVLIHPQWLKGCQKHDEQGREYGGSTTDPVDSTTRWSDVRCGRLRLVEVRGNMPEMVTCPSTGTVFRSDGGTVGKSGHFTCQAATCGLEQKTVEAIGRTHKTAPVAPVVGQAYSHRLDRQGDPFGGRFFTTQPMALRYASALSEWDARKNCDLADFWPTSQIPFGHMTHQRQPLPDHGFTHWWMMFNPVQLLVHAQILKAIRQNTKASRTVREFVLGAFLQYLRCNNMMSIWHTNNNQISAFLSSPNFHPKANTVESSVFAPVGDGSWRSAMSSLLEACEWRQQPWELVVLESAVAANPELQGLGGYTMKAKCHDPIGDAFSLAIGSATSLESERDNSCDLVITDPPFGGLLYYSELSDFFYVWLRLALRESDPDNFSSEYAPKALEAVANIALHPEDPDAFYQRILTACWREAYRILKAGGILAFTFHHSEDEPWVGVLESLFDAGFYLEATYPIRSDETKGEGEFGSKQIEYDIIHVCRKRITEPQPISWARLRRQITDDVRRIRNLLTQHQTAGLPAADLQVIKRGKALEYFSRHYGKVYIEQGREFTIREALVGINSMLDDETAASSGTEAPPANAEPYTRQFFRIFYETTQVPRDQMQKFLRGTGIAPSDFEERGWCSEKSKVFTLTPPMEIAQNWKGISRKGMARDFDQTMFLVGGCFEGSSVRVTDTLDSPHFAPHPATGELVDWLARHGGSQEIKFAAQRARTIYRDWLSKDQNKKKAAEQLVLFDMDKV